MGPRLRGDDIVERAQKTGPRGPVLSSSFRPTSIVAAVEAVVMVMVIMMMMAVSGHDDDPGPITIIIVSAILAVVMMVVVMMMMIELGELHISVRRLGRRRFIDSLQQRSRVRDRLQQVGEGIRPQNVAWGRTRRWRGLSGIQCPECRHRSQKPSDLLFHFFLQ